MDVFVERLSIFFRGGEYKRYFADFFMQRMSLFFVVTENTLVERQRDNVVPTAYGENDVV